MSPFNDSVERPSIKKKPTTTNAIGNLVKLGALGVVGLGLVISNSLLPVTPGQDPQRDTVTAFLAHELTENCAGTGCVQIIAGVTEAGDIYTLSGSVTVGDPRFPLCSLSSTGAIQGSNCVITAGVTLPSNIEAALLSGATVHAQDLLTTSGSLVVEENQTVTLNGLTYNFPSTVGDCLSQSGCVLVLTGATLDTLEWAAQSGGGGGGGSAGCELVYSPGAQSSNADSGTWTSFGQTYDIPLSSVSQGDQFIVTGRQWNGGGTRHLRVQVDATTFGGELDGIGSSGEFRWVMTVYSTGASGTASVQFTHHDEFDIEQTADTSTTYTIDTTQALTIDVQGRQTTGSEPNHYLNGLSVMKCPAPTA